MRNAGLTKQERAFRLLMRIWAVTFLLAGFLFALIPAHLIDYLSRIGELIFGWKGAKYPPDEGYFWVVLTFGLLITLSYLCTVAQRNLIDNMGYARAVILAKFVTAAGFAICLAVGGQFVYLVGAIVDGAIFIITWWMYVAAGRSRARCPGGELFTAGRT